MVAARGALVKRDAASYLGERRDLSIPMANANLYSLAILPLVALLAAVFVYLWGYGALSDGATFERPVVSIVAVYVIGFLVVAFGIAAHEAIHGLSWAYFGGKQMSAIKFGFQVKTLTPYAHCKEPIEARTYRIEAAMPGLVVGLLPSLVGIATGNGWIMLFGLFFTFAAGGDLLVLWLIRKVDAKVCWSRTTQLTPAATSTSVARGELRGRSLSRRLGATLRRPSAAPGLPGRRRTER